VTPPIRVAVRRLPHALDLPLPSPASAHAAGLDLRAALAAPVTLPPGGHQLIPTGLELAIPIGFEGQVRPRSGLALRHQVTVLNAPGTIDADYRGEVGVLLINLGSVAFTIDHGDRIAQLVIAPVAAVDLLEVTDLPPSARGDGGFGSTGRV
jgi:dUTP pyrophosphatase